MSNDNHQESFIRKYIFSIDHKWIGIQYGVTSMLFLLFGFILMMIMRYQLAYNVNTGLEKDSGFNSKATSWKGDTVLPHVIQSSRPSF